MYELKGKSAHASWGTGQLSTDGRAAGRPARHSNPASSSVRAEEAWQDYRKGLKIKDRLSTQQGRLSRQGRVSRARHVRVPELAESSHTDWLPIDGHWPAACRPHSTRTRRKLSQHSGAATFKGKVQGLFQKRRELVLRQTNEHLI